jgi:hypothetical protein
MSKIIIDLSGQVGLLERHQGDLNDTSAVPNLRYLGAEGSFADGIFNPLKTYGYISPAVNTFTTLTGTIAAPLNSIQYDPQSDVVYLAEEGENILKLDGLDDIVVSNYLSITAGHDIKDMLIYEVNGKKCVLYAIDTNTDITYTSSTVRTGGMYVGFKTIDPTEGLTLIDNNLADEELGTGSLYHTITSTAGVSGWGGPKARKLAQQFNSSDFFTGTSSVTNPTNGTAQISGVDLALSLEGGTGAGITMKLSIQTAASASAGDFTSRGAWSNAVTDYAVNNTVTNGGFTWQCILAHSAAAIANEEPGVGSAWEDYWNRFGAPSGTEVASVTFALSTISNLSNFSRYIRTHLDFSSVVSLTANTEYWLVLEESGSNMSGSTDQLTWMSTLNDDGIYLRYAKAYQSTLGRWETLNINGDILTAQHDDFDFSFVLNRQDDWSATSATGQFDVQPNQDNFLYLADNGLTYWIVGNRIHTLDGSLTGGFVGKVTEDALVFPSYIEIADVAETRSRMYIGIQMADRLYAGNTESRTFGANRVGVYAWDRRTQIQGAADFYPCPGAKEIRSVFMSSTGDILCITLGNSGFTELRGISGNQFAVLHTFEKAGYPPSRRGVSQLDNLSVWFGKNGILYGYGSVAGGRGQLYKLGTMAAQANAGLIPGPIFVGHEESSEPRSGIFLGWEDGDPSYVLQKWYPHGDGTIDTIAQKPNQGDIYTKVYNLPSLSTIKYLRLMMAPGTATGTTTVANLKCYYNQSATAAWTKAITLDDIHKGWKNIEINKNNVNFVQFEIEYVTSITLGDSDFKPMYLELEYDDERRINP